MLRRLMICMITLWLVGCAGTSQVSVVATPTAAPIQPAVTPTNSAERVQARFVSGKLLQDFSWTPDSRTLEYAQTEKCPTGCKTAWYRLDVATGITNTFKPEIVTIDPQVWKHLTDLDEFAPEISPQQSRSISPSGTWVIYSRVEPGYADTCLGPCPPPMELWLARVDGSGSGKIGDLGSDPKCFAMGWFEAESKVLLRCGYGGSSYFAVADVRNHVLTDLDAIVGRRFTYFDWAALSPDGARLAVNIPLTTTTDLLLVPLDGSSIIHLGQGTKAPQWSPDSRRLYYLQQITPGQCAPAVIHAYDFITHQDKIVLGPEVALGPTQRVTLNECKHSFLISPAEDVTLLLLGEGGSWIVGLY